MYSPRGVVDLALSEDDIPALARRGNAMRLAGIDAELLDLRGLERFVPELEARRTRRFPLVGALVQRRGGTVRHDAVAWGYARAGSALGVDIIEDCEVTGVRAAGNNATGVETSRGYVQAERIVFATAGHTGMIGAMLGVALPIETHLLQAMVSEPIKPLINSVLVYVSPGHGETYICQSDRGGLVMGGHLDGFPSYTREGQWHRLEDVVQGALELFPRIGAVKILRHWAGTNDMTMDGSPIMDRLRYDNVFVNAGWCYGGFKAIPASGAAFAKFVASGTAPDLIRAYRLSRFATGHMLDEPGQGPFPVRL
jgi:heterotetrameric sarcosine oxidase beta subunit